jgi:uncharacterized protein (TIGR02099 family)
MADTDTVPEQIPEPSPLTAPRGLRVFARLTRWALLTVAGVWLVVALLWVLLHGFIVPRIGDFKPLLETQASRIVGREVHIGVLQAHSSGLLPSFEALDIEVLDAQRDEGLRLGRVLFTLSPTSLLRAAFDQIVIDRPSVDVHRAADGTWSVAGLVLEGSSDGSLADWLFSNAEVVVEEGRLRWIDETRPQADPLVLNHVRLVLRNSLQRHHFRVDATPDPHWGEPFSVRGQFRQPLLSLREGNWAEWTGTLYAQFSQFDLRYWRHLLPQQPSWEVLQGQGWARAWLDIRQGQVQGVTTDLSLSGVQARLTSEHPIALDKAQGRLSLRPWNHGFEVTTEGLSLQGQQAMPWAAGRWRLAWSPALGAQPEQGEWQIDRVDLDGLLDTAALASPTQETIKSLRSRQLQGVVRDLKGQWQGRWPSLDQYRVQGQVERLSLQTLSGKPATGQPAWPGVQGLQAKFDVTQDGGTAQVRMERGSLQLPAWLEDGPIAVQELGGDLSWKRERAGWVVQLANGKLSNADLSGEVQGSWSSSGVPQTLGALDLQATLKRVEAKQVSRYLPLTLPENVRHYLRDALKQGTAENVKLRVRGNLDQFPFVQTQQGEFRLTAQLNRVTYAYVPGAPPASATAPATSEWPALTDLQGELLIERDSLQIKGGKSRLAGAPNLAWSGLEASIPRLATPVVEVRADARGPLGETLRLLQTPGLNRLLSQTLDKSTGTGNVDLKLRLSLPLDRLEQTKASGQVVFANNDLNLMPAVPGLQRLRGTLQFSETGLTLSSLQARLLGGEARLEGGLRWTPSASEPAMQLRIQGYASAEGLRQQRDWQAASRVWSLMEGGASYNAVMQWQQGLPDLVVTSNLQGLSLQAPAPLGKTADSSQAFRLEYGLTPDSRSAPSTRWHDQFMLTLGPALKAQLVRDIGTPTARVLRGGVSISQDTASAVILPPEGMALNARFDELLLDPWSAWLDKLGANPASLVTPPSSRRTNTPAQPDALQDFWPSAVALSAQRVTSEGRTLHNLVVGATRQGDLWRATLSADELNGYSEYRPATSSQPARLYARLARLVIPPSAVSQVDTLLSEQPTSMPALDIVVSDLELKGKRLGRAEIDAVNRVNAQGNREWQLNKLNLSNADATFNARGNWQASGPQSVRRTQLDFTLDVQDAGDLLGRLGSPGLVRQGKGKLAGQVGWSGSPMSPDYASMNGQFNIQIERGQFLKTEPGAARLFGVLNLQALPRRLMLDFRDVFSEGFAFDAFRGDVSIQQGMASTNNLQMKGVNAAVLMEGRADIERETQDIKVVVVPEINAGTAALFYGTINPVLGLTSYLAQYFLSRPLVKVSTQEFHVSGSWSDPQVKKVDQ